VCARDDILKRSLARYAINGWSEFHQIYNFARVGDKDERSRF